MSLVLFGKKQERIEDGSLREKGERTRYWSDSLLFCVAGMELLVVTPFLSETPVTHQIGDFGAASQDTAGHEVIEAKRSPGMLFLLGVPHKGIDTAD